ncbi:putative ribonuclease H-like domain-containing protein [Tanacetum coccineum]
MIYEDFDQVDQLEMEELDLKWQMAMLSLRINRFEKKAGRKMNYNNQQPARFDRRKVRCYKCLQLGHFARECNVKTVDDKARYSAFKVTEVKTDEPKALVSVDSMVNWSDHAAENKTGEVEKVYGMMAGLDNGGADVSEAAAEFAMMGISPKVQNCPLGCDSKINDLNNMYNNLDRLYNDCYIKVQAYQNAVKTLESQKDWYHKTQIALEEKIRILSANLENTTNTLSYTEKLHDQAQKEKKEWEVKFEATLARFEKWKESSKNLKKLINSSMSTRTKIGLGFKEYFGKDEVFDLSTPSVMYPEPVEEVKPLYSWFVKAGEMHAVPPSITGTYMPTPYKSDIEETQVSYGSKSDNKTSETLSESNDFVSCDNSDKSSDSETYASCDSSLKTKTKDFPPAIDIKTLPESDVEDPNSTAGSPSFSCLENVKSPRIFCNKSGMNNRNVCKNNSVRVKKCFVCGSKLHLIKDCDLYTCVEFVPCKTQAASVPAGSRNSPASVTADGSDPAASRNRPAVNSAGRPNPAGWSKRPAPVSAGRPVSAGWLNPAARPYFRPSSVQFNNKDTILPDESQVVLRIPRERDLYTFNISELQPEQNVTCLVAKASLDESTRWHRRMAHVNFKTINKLAKEGLVDGLPLKDETFYVLKEFIALIENQLNKKVKGIRCDNGTEFKNAKLIEFFCGEKELEGLVGNPRTHKQRSFIQAMVLSVMERNADYAEELAKLQRQEYEAKNAAARYGYLFSQETANILSQAKAEIRNQGVSANRDPAGIDSAGGVSAGRTSAGSDPAGDNPADSFEPAGSFEPAAPAVEVNPVPTKRVNTIHPQSQILGDLASPVLTRSRAQKSKFGESAFIGYIQDQQRTNHTDQLHCLFACFLSQLEPTSIAKALEDPDWVAAMQEEMQQFINQKVWTLVPLPDGKNAIGTKWILKNKRDARGIVVRNKARWIVKSAFLYGEIEVKCMSLSPKGLKILNFPKHVRGTIDKTLFIKKDSRDISFVQVYVDDIIFGSTNKAWCEEFEVLMKGEFEMSAMGEMSFFLGLQVKQLPDGIFISQDKYVKDMLTKFDMESVRTATTPYEAAKTKLKDETDPPVNVHLYRSMIGSLMYLTASRPDIMFAVSACSRHQVTPLTSHLNAVKKIFKYLKGQPKLGLWYPKDSPFQLEAYSDSDYAGSHGDRKSTTGGCQFLGRRLISWQCKKQTIVATSSTEAEYVAAASCCAQVLWIQNQLLDYGFNFMNTKIFIDNQSTICIVKNPVFHQRTKHIEIRHHFIRDANEKNLIQVLKIHTDDNVADLLTKAFDGPRFEYLVVHIGMVVKYCCANDSLLLLHDHFLLLDLFLLGFFMSGFVVTDMVDVTTAASLKMGKVE